MQKLDPRDFSKKSYQALLDLKKKVHQDDLGKASSAVQSLPSYISTWGLHRLCGDAVKYTKHGSKETEYKGKVYEKFLLTLKEVSEEKFKPMEPETLIEMPLRQYTGLNHLGIQLAQEWSFWAVPVLGKGKN